MKSFQKGTQLALALALGAGASLVSLPASEAAVFHCPTSTICVHSDTYFRGARQDISGYSPYTNLNRHLHDRASSWINANRNTAMGIGEHRYGYQHIGQVLPPGWYEDNMEINTKFNDKADFVKHV